MRLHTQGLELLHLWWWLCHFSVRLAVHLRITASLCKLMGALSEAMQEHVR